jgi:hypothetical protein
MLDRRLAAEEADKDGKRQALHEPPGNLVDVMDWILEAAQELHLLVAEEVGRVCDGRRAPIDEG